MADAGPARRVAFDILLRVETAGAYASLLLERLSAALADPRDAALAREIVFGVLRRRAALDHAIAGVAGRPTERIDPEVITALRIGAYALFFLDRVPGFAAVDTAVTLVRTSRRRNAAEFVNGVLRALARSGSEALPPPASRGDVAALALAGSHPHWWVERLVARLGWDRAEALIAADNSEAPTVLHVNTRRVTRDELAARLATEGFETQPGRWAPTALRLGAGSLRRTTALDEGLAWVQDEAAQLVPRLLGATLGPSVVDLCAAPGGKTLAIAARLPQGGRVVAADRHPGRLRRLRRGAARCGADAVLVVAADLLAGSPFRERFDQVLVDAPCSGTGTLRRHPEIRWRLTPGALKVSSIRQERLLDVAAGCVRAGGVLVYSVCSIEPEEGAEVVERFLERHRAFRIADPRPLFDTAARALVGDDFAMRTDPAQDGMDGFFAVRLERSEEVA